MVGKKVIDADNKWWDDPSARGRIMAREKNMVDIVLNVVCVCVCHV